MNANEALEQVRGLHAPSGVYVPEDDECAVCQQPWPCETSAILDAVTTDVPVTVVDERKALVEVMRDRDDMFVTFEMHADAILAAGFHLTPATPERTEQEREAAVERVTEAIYDAGELHGLDNFYVSDARVLARAAFAAHEGREVSE